MSPIQKTMRWSISVYVVLIVVAGTTVQGALLASGSKIIVYGYPEKTPPAGLDIAWGVVNSPPPSTIFWLFEPTAVEEGNVYSVSETDGHPNWAVIEDRLTDGVLGWSVTQQRNPDNGAGHTPDHQYFDFFIDGDPERIDLEGWDIEEIRLTIGTITDPVPTPVFPGYVLQNITVRTDYYGTGPGISSCPADLDDNDTVNVFDLLELLLAWGQSDVPADIDGSGTVNVFDLLELLLAWGACSE